MIFSNLKVIFCAILFAAVFLVGVQARSLSDIVESGFVRIGVLNSTSLMLGHTDKNGKYYGYDALFAERVARDLGEQVSLLSAQRFEALAKDEVDILIANVTVTSERAERIDFALPYMKTYLGALAKASEDITDAESLNYRTIIVVRGTTGYDYVKRIFFDSATLKVYDDYNDAINALKAGEGSVFVGDNIQVIYWAKVNPGLEAKLVTLGDLDTIAPAVKKGNFELLGWLNDEIIKLGKERFFHKAYERSLAPTFGDAINADDIVVEGGKL